MSNTPTSKRLKKLIFPIIIFLIAFLVSLLLYLFNVIPPLSLINNYLVNSIISSFIVGIVILPALYFFFKNWKSFLIASAGAAVGCATYLGVSPFDNWFIPNSVTESLFAALLFVLCICSTAFLAYSFWQAYKNDYFKSAIFSLFLGAGVGALVYYGFVPSFVFSASPILGVIIFSVFSFAFSLTILTNGKFFDLFFIDSNKKIDQSIYGNYSVPKGSASFSGNSLDQVPGGDESDEDSQNSSFPSCTIF